jgi:hypothetical protein
MADLISEFQDGMERTLLWVGWSKTAANAHAQRRGPHHPRPLTGH